MAKTTGTKNIADVMHERAAVAAVNLLAQALIDPNSPMAEMAKAMTREDVAARSARSQYTPDAAHQRASQTLTYERDKTDRPAMFDTGRMNKALKEFQAAEKQKAEDARNSPFNRAMELFSGRMLAVIGPLAILAGVLSSAGSGFGVLMSAVNLLIAVLAPVLLPLFVVLAVAVAEFAKTLMPHMLKAGRALADFMLNYVLPVFQTLAKVVGSAIGFLVDFGASLVSATKKVFDFFRTDSKATTAAAKSAGDTLDRGLRSPDVARYLGGRGEVGGSAAGSTAYDLIRDAMATAKSVGGEKTGEKVAAKTATPADEKIAKLDPAAAKLVADGKAAGKAGDTDMLAAVIKSLELSIGPKAQISSISQAYKNAQLAAINADPLDQLAKRAIIESLQELKKIAAHTKDGGVGI